MIDDKVETEEAKKYEIIFAKRTLINKVTKQKIWDFDLKRIKGDCDYLLLIGISRFVHPEKAFLIPAKNLPTRHIRISIKGVSKWHKFMIWEHPKKTK